jgi:hypothetical protein
LGAVGHAVLLGDSIFDNSPYVWPGPPVVEQLRRALPAGWQSTLLAVDGAITAEVHGQLSGLPPDATHICLSSGGNDALRAIGILAQRVGTVSEAAGILAAEQARFRAAYEALFKVLLHLRKPLIVCTVYDSIPGLSIAARAALALFNEIILRSAFAAHAVVIDLRLVCDEAADYSALSPIEPSVHGGAKIVQAISEVVTQHDFSVRGATVYGRQAGRGPFPDHLTATER